MFKNASLPLKLKSFGLLITACFTLTAPVHSQVSCLDTLCLKGTKNSLILKLSDQLTYQWSWADQSFSDRPNATRTTKPVHSFSPDNRFILVLLFRHYIPRRPSQSEGYPVQVVYDKQTMKLFDVYGRELTANEAPLPLTPKMRWDLKHTHRLEQDPD